jgi:endonuclease/exonuclease/phosphatase family metal-dependent hydrolase
MLKNCGVLLNGDFNSGADSRNYEFLIETFGARDLYREYCRKNKVKEELSFDSSENAMIEWNG